MGNVGIEEVGGEFKEECFHSGISRGRDSRGFHNSEELGRLLLGPGLHHSDEAGVALGLEN